MAGVRPGGSSGKGSTVWSRVAQPDRFGICLLLIVCTILATALAAGKWGRLVALGVEDVTLFYVLWTTRVRRRIFVLVLSVAAAATLVGVLGLFISGGEKIVPAVEGLIAIVAPLAIVARLRTHQKIDAAAVFGALCLYLSLGLIFALVFSAAGLISPPFFAQKATSTSTDFVYFSFVTLTTVGYGDLTAASDLGRMLAVSEALLGQLYLVSVVALLVSNLGRERPSRA